jgi:hypothetical protein
MKTVYNKPRLLYWRYRYHTSIPIPLLSSPLDYLLTSPQHLVPLLSPQVPPHAIPRIRSPSLQTHSPSLTALRWSRGPTGDATAHHFSYAPWPHCGQHVCGPYEGAGGNSVEGGARFCGAEDATEPCHGMCAFVGGVNAEVRVVYMLSETLSTDAYLRCGVCSPPIVRMRWSICLPCGATT